jgi:hypothetical protein
MHRNSNTAPLRLVALLGAALSLGACDLGVTNPALLTSDDLNDPRLIPALTTGAISDVYEGVQGDPLSTGGVYDGVALLTDELVHSGTNFGFRVLSDGLTDDDEPDAERRWNLAARGRFSVESTIQRFQAFPDSLAGVPLVNLTLWAGYANRILGDNFCGGTIDGGPRVESRVFFERAEAHFTDAIARATARGLDSLRTAAYAGRAQSRMMLGKWPGAVADAAEVPISFQVPIIHSTSGRSANRIWNFGFNSKQLTVWGTPFSQWGLNVTRPTTGERDSRVQFNVTPVGGTTDTLGADLRRPHYRLLKFASQEDDNWAARGTEMRLIEAEAPLAIRGDFSGVVAKINEVRTFRNIGRSAAQQIPMLPASAAPNLDAAWELLMKERGIEFWLEGRRLADFRRWSTTPGKDKVPFLKVREAVRGELAAADLQAMKRAIDVPNLCLPISRSEKRSNPNYAD